MNLLGLVFFGFVYLIGINSFGFFLMYIDKQKAKKKEWRVPEKNLFLVAIFGGSIGTNMGMQVFRHKTKHSKFVIGMPLILIVQISLGLYLCYNFIYYS